MHMRGMAGVRARAAGLGLLLLCAASPALSQVPPSEDDTKPFTGFETIVPPSPRLNQDCTATVLNRLVQVSPNGAFAVGNVPVPVGAFRVRVVCERASGVDLGASPFILGVPNGETVFGPITFGLTDPITVSLSITSPATVLTPTANGAQLVTTGKLVDGTLIDIT